MGPSPGSHPGWAPGRFPPGSASRAPGRPRSGGLVMSASSPAKKPDFLESEPFVVELDRFTGPLDLLLHLIRSQDIDVFDIPIARITAQFQAALAEGIERLRIDRAGEFVEMASTLVRIKARLLLPREGDPEWEEDPRANLVRRLLEYEHYHEVAAVLSASEAERSRHFGKGYVEPRETPDVCVPELETTREEFLRAACSVPEPREGETHRAPVRTVTVAEKISLLGRLLRRARRVSFDRLVSPWGTRDHAVAGLMACLELGRQQLVRIRQVDLFGAIWLTPGPRAEELEESGGAEVLPGPADPGSAGLEPGSGAPDPGRGAEDREGGKA